MNILWTALVDVWGSLEGKRLHQGELDLKCRVSHQFLAEHLNRLLCIQLQPRQYMNIICPMNVLYWEESSTWRLQTLLESLVASAKSDGDASLGSDLLLFVKVPAGQWGSRYQSVHLTMGWTPQLDLISEHWLSQEVTMNGTPQRSSDSSLSINEDLESQIHDSDDGKTGNQGKL